MPSVAAGAVGVELASHRRRGKQGGQKARQGDFEGGDGLGIVSSLPALGRWFNRG